MPPPPFFTSLPMLPFPPAVSSGGSGGKNKNTWPVFVGGISFDTPEIEVAIHFFGRPGLRSFKLATQPMGGGSRGFGFAEFDDVPSALEAIKVVDGVEVRGRKLRLRWGENSTTTPEVDEFHRAPDRFKTRLCYEVSKKQPCPRGDDCPYAHSDNELRKLGGMQPEVGAPGGGSGAQQQLALTPVPPAFVKVEVPFADFPGSTDEEKQRAAYTAVMGKGASNVRSMMRKTGYRLQVRGTGDRAPGAAKESDCKDPLHIIVRPGLDGKMIDDENMDLIRRTIDDIVAVALGRKRIEDSILDEPEEKKKPEPVKEPQKPGVAAGGGAAGRRGGGRDRGGARSRSRGGGADRGRGGPSPKKPDGGPTAAAEAKPSDLADLIAKAAAAAVGKMSAAPPAMSPPAMPPPSAEPEVPAKAVKPARPECEQRLPGFSPGVEDEATMQFFVVRPATLSSIQTSVRRGLWATSRSITELLEEAFRKFDHVVLLFSALTSGHFQGYALMTTAPDRRLEPGLLGSSDVGDSFKVSWLKQCMLSHTKTDMLRHGEDSGEVLRKSRDGQEVGVELGERLVRLMFQQPSQDLLALPPDDDDDVDALLGGGTARTRSPPRSSAARRSRSRSRRRSRSRGRRGDGAWVPPSGAPPPGPWVPPGGSPPGMDPAAMDGRAAWAAPAASPWGAPPCGGPPPGWPGAAGPPPGWPPPMMHGHPPPPFGYYPMPGAPPGYGMPPHGYGR